MIIITFSFYRQGAEERSSLLYKLQFSRYKGANPGGVVQKKQSPISPASGLSVPELREEGRPSVSLVSSSSTTSQKARAAFFSPLSPAASPPSTAPSTASTISPSLSAWLESRKHTPTRPSETATSIGRPPRSAMIDYRSVRGQEKPQTQVMSQSPEIRSPPTPAPSSPSVSHEVEVSSQDVEAGLQQLLAKVLEVYGGRGNVRTEKRLFHSRSSGNVLYSVQFVGPEEAARLLDTALQSISQLQTKGPVWRFTQKIEVNIKQQ